MKIKLISVGKIASKPIVVLLSEYQKRLTKYVNYTDRVIIGVKNAKNLSPAQVKAIEAKSLLESIEKSDLVVLLDEKGKSYTSVNFSNWLNQLAIQGVKNVTFVIGGAYGFDEQIYAIANYKMRISDMTFPHPLAKLIFVEQLYRAYTIQAGHPYHNF